MFVHRIVMSVGGMAAALGGLNALAFTGGIGENSEVIRARVCEALGFLGDVPVLVIPAREDLSILRAAKRVLAWR
jgi:acetate kinase